MNFYQKFMLPFVTATLAISFCNESLASSAHNKSICIFNSDFSETNQRYENGIEKVVSFIDEKSPTYTLQDRMRSYKVPAISMTIINKGQVSFSAVYGVSNKSKMPKNRCNTLFQAASISKPVTMMAIMRMAQKGRLNLDADIHNYLTSFSLPKNDYVTKQPVTFRNILSHTSGVNPGGYMGYLHTDELPTDTEILSGLAPSNTPAIEVINVPGEVLNYSGGAYTLAERALQDSFKQPFEDIMTDWVIKPLNMKNSTFQHPIEQTSEVSIASGHDINGNQVEHGWRNYPQQAAAGLWSTSEDLAKFLIEMSKGYQGQSEIFRQQLISKLLSDKRFDHVYGFISPLLEQPEIIIHYGGNVGYRSAMVINLKTGNGAVFLTNADNGASLNRELLGVLADINDWPLYEQTEVRRHSLATITLKSIAGTYEFKEQGWQISAEYSEDHDKLAIRFPNNELYLLTPIAGESDNNFIHEDTGVRASFTKSGETINIRLYGQTGERVN